MKYVKSDEICVACGKPCEEGEMLCWECQRKANGELPLYDENDKSKFKKIRRK